VDKCIFCEIAAGRAPASIVYEDADVVAFMDIRPVNPGHLLVITREHHRNIFDCPPALAGKLLAAAARLAGPLQRATNAAGMNLLIANERAGGQDVFHIHLHMLPRHVGDGFGFRLPPSHPHRPLRTELDEMAAAIRKQITEEELP